MFPSSIILLHLRLLVRDREQHLRTYGLLVREYVAHYNRERNHQGLGNLMLAPQQDNSAVGPIRRRERPGGLLSYYYREAA